MELAMELNIFARVYCRGDVTSIKRTVDAALIEKALQYKKMELTSELEEEIEEVFDTIDDFYVSQILIGIIRDIEPLEGIKLDEWVECCSLGGVLEEITFGIGHNERAAKIAFVDAEESVDFQG
jgi:hypothetical protein